MNLQPLEDEPIVYKRDIPYTDTGNPAHLLDVYLPMEPAGEPLPVIVYFTGGGWWEGNKDAGGVHLRPYLRTGKYAGVSINYRLSGEATWPAQIHDCNAAIRWIRANAGDYGFDPGRIAVWGRSAGGHLALMTGLASGVAELEGGLGPHTSTSSDVAAIVNYFGVTEMLAMIGQPGNYDRTDPEVFEARLIGGPLLDNRETARAASPITYISAGDPPVITLHGTADMIVPYDQATRLDRALREAGVPSTLITITDAGHGDDFPPAADERAAAFLARVLLGEDVAVADEVLEK